MGFFTSKSNFPWINLTSIEQFNAFFDGDDPFFVFKHSTRCSISSMALSRFESEYKGDEQIMPLFLDLIRYREVSNFIADKTGVYHQSPQLIFIKNKKVLDHASHEQINADKILTTYEKL